MRKDVFIRLRRLVEKASYPTNKLSLIEHVDRAGDATDIVDLVQKFENREYIDAHDALTEVARIENEYHTQ